MALLFIYLFKLDNSFIRASTLFSLKFDLGFLWRVSTIWIHIEYCKALFPSKGYLSKKGTKSFRIKSLGTNLNLLIPLVSVYTLPHPRVLTIKFKTYKLSFFLTYFKCKSIIIYCITSSIYPFSSKLCKRTFTCSKSRNSSRI